MWPRTIDSFWFTILYPISLALFIAGGYFFAYLNYKKKGKLWKPSGIETAIIGIFALLISFTFVSSGNAMKERIRLIHQESDAVAELNRGFHFFRSGMADTLRTYVVRYLTLQISFQKEEITHPDSVMNDVVELNRSLWESIGPAITQSKDVEDDMKSIMPSLNKLNSTFFAIVYSYKERTPPIIITLLIIASWLMGVMVGFMNGFHDEAHVFVPFIYFLIVALTMQAIRDLDNPYMGSIQPGYENLEMIRNVILHSMQ